MKRRKNTFENQKLFTPSVVRRFTTSTGIIRDQTQNSLSGSKPTDPSGSFRLDPPGSPLKSTQQIPVDYSAFENHTFFSSAMTNVNICFEKIINLFPFDGTLNDYDEWLDQLSGFEKYVLDRYPSYTGYLTFKGDNKFINVIDRAGVVFPSISRRNDASTVLSPGASPIFIEMDLAIPDDASNDQFIFHHVSDTGVGYAGYVNSSLSTDSEVDVNFIITSGSLKLRNSARVEKGKFSHLSFYYDPSINKKKSYIRVGEELNESKERITFESLNTGGSPLVIASGSTVDSFTPTTSFSGSINNFRVFHKVREKSDIDRYTTRTQFAEDGLKLNLRFNEATGSYRNNDTVLDHSGNSLHSRIQNYNSSLRTEKPYKSLSTFENSVAHPTLFPGHPDVISLNETLLTSGSTYDENNPNLITKLIPQHYLDMARASMNSTGDSTAGSTYEGIINPDAVSNSTPGAAKIGQPQIISALLFMWARTFDEIKIMADHVSELVHIDYDSSTGISKQFLPFLAEYYGFELPNMFKNADYDQFFSGENVFSEPTNDLMSLQNEIWRRVLSNMREIISSKGTVHSIRSLFRSAGIDSDRIFRFVEHGGSNKLRLGKSRRNITEISTLLDFSGSMTYVPSSTEDIQGFDSHKPNLISHYLSSSRVEIGTPAPAGAFVSKDLFEPHGISNNANDGLLTSGSWTAEGRFRFPRVNNYMSPQSILRMHVTGSTPTHGVVMNLVADPKIDAIKDDPQLILYCRPGFLSTDPTLKLVLTGANIFDGNKWYVSVGRTRNDAIQSTVSSSYFINLARQQFGELIEYHTTSSHFLESSPTTAGEIPNAFQLISNPVGPVEQNKSGSFLVVGQQNIDNTKNYFLNDTSVERKARTTDFSGRSGHYRFWSKSLTTTEVKEHARNFLSLGVDDPLVNFGFNHEVTGSFERLRLDLSTDQPLTSSDPTGFLEILDFSQQTLLSGTINRNVGSLRGFEPSVTIIKPERFDFSMISPAYDYISDHNKVRVSGYTQANNINEFETEVAPVHSLPPNMVPQDDSRFSIEFSVVQAVNEDIMKIFATLESLETIVGGPENMFSTYYPGLRQLREIYFNRLTGNVNYTAFFEFFRWLDESFDELIDNLIPRKTNYLGFNMIIEPHALERSRIAYGSGDVYLGESERRNLKGMILLRQLVTKLKRF